MAVAGAKAACRATIMSQAIMANPDVEFKAYYEPMHLKYKGNIKLPVTEDIARRIICLPSWYKVDRQKVIETVKKVIEK